MTQKKSVTMIPARARVGNSASKEVKPKLRVCAYCRVSTDSDEQATSYEAQVEHYTHYIQKNPDWEFAGIFADDGISGTNTKKREEFNRMIDAAMTGEIDMIITKSISRFARNTLDCLKYIRELKDKNVPVFFEKENINTMDAKGEVLLTIMASLAQQESESLSKNVKLGLQFRYQNGQVQVNHTHFMGFTKDENGKLIIEPTEAEVVKRIFREYLEGSSLKQICRGLEADGILTGAGKPKWRPETVHTMLKNEKYMGDALLQKTYTVDVLNKKRVPNNGIVPQYYVTNSHEAIIPRDVFNKVQEEMVRRNNLTSGSTGRKRMYCSKYALSSIVCCTKCGEIYRRVVWNNRGKKRPVWRCTTRMEEGVSACNVDAIDESELQECVVKALNRMLGKKNKVYEILQMNIETVLAEEGHCDLATIEEQMETLQQELVQRVNQHLNYDDLLEKMDALQKEKHEAETKRAERESIKMRIEEMREFLATQTDAITEYDELLVRRMIERIDVYDDRFTFYFKSGTSIDIKRNTAYYIAP